MTSLQSAIDALTALSNVLMVFAYFIPLIFFSLLAFWRENHILFILVFGYSWVLSLNAPDLISGPYSTTNIDLAVTAVLWIYALFCMGMALRLMFFKLPAAQTPGD